jgi:hypothetical protein
MRRSLLLLPSRRTRGAGARLRKRLAAMPALSCSLLPGPPTKGKGRPKVRGLESRHDSRLNDALLLIRVGLPGRGKAPACPLPRAAHCSAA